MILSLLATSLARGGHVRLFRVQSSSPAGWEASEREGQRILLQRHYSDWHRVELTLARFTREIEALKGEGWRET